jgi:ATP-dependent Lon protease
MTILNRKKETETPELYALLPVKNTVIFPGVAVTLNVGEERSKKLLSDLGKGEKIVIAALKDVKLGVADPDNIHEVGIVATIIRAVEGDGLILLVIHGEHRVKLVDFKQNDPYFRVRVTALDENLPKEKESYEDLVYQIKELGGRMIKELGLPREAKETLHAIKDPGNLADMVASTLKIEKGEKQDLLETLDVRLRLEKIITLMTMELRKIGLSKDLNKKVSEEMDKNQREFYLRQQMKAIKEELHEDEVTEIEELEKKIKEAGMPTEVEEVALKEVNRLSKIHANSAEYTVSRTYISWLLDVPWSKSTEDNGDIEKAKVILEEGHYGLKKVKKRILTMFCRPTWCREDLCSEISGRRPGKKIC